MMFLWAVVLQTCFLLAWSGASNGLTPTEINDLCKNSFISDDLGYGYTSKGTCSREYYQCTPSLNTYKVKLMHCGLKTVWDNLSYGCVHPYQSSDSCTATSCSGDKYKDNVYCNRYTECKADETVEDKCCPDGQMFDKVTSACVSKGAAVCNVDSSCYSNVAPASTCVKNKLPFLIADTASCDRYSYCPWIYPNAKLQCCPGNLVWNQAIQSCDYPNAANSGCIRQCLNDVPSDCDFIEMRLCMPLADSAKDYSRSRFAVTNHGVTFTTVDGKKAAYFDDNRDQLQIAGFRNLWNGNTPTDIQISLEFKILPGSFVANNWIRGTSTKLMSNADCSSHHSLAILLQTVATAPEYYLFVKLEGNYFQSHVIISEGPWYTMRFRFFGKTSTLELLLDGVTDTEVDPKVSFINMKNPLVIGNSGCKLDNKANMYIRNVKFSEKHF